MVGVKVIGVPLDERVVRVKDNIRAISKNAGPGQVEVLDADFQEILNVIEELEALVYGS